MRKNAFYKRSDFYIGVGFLVVCIVLCWQISLIKVKESRLFPSFATIVTGVSGAWLVIQSFIHKEGENAKKLVIHVKEWLTLISLFIGYFLFTKLGFYVTLFLVISSIAMILEYPLSKKKVVFSLSYSLIVTVFCFLCFYLVLGLYTPTGILI